MVRSGNLQIGVIGGTDSSGGAGVSVDQSVILEHGCSPKCVISAITAQCNSSRIRITEIPSRGFQAQLESMLELSLDAIKIGMLPSRESVLSVLNFLKLSSFSPVILDPVKKTTSGSSLISCEGWAALRSELLPRVDLITPNLEEAQLLADCNEFERNPHRLAEECLKLGARAVLIKGGHGQGKESIDLLGQCNKSLVSYKWHRVNGGENLRGTGCRLATSIACNWAKTNDLGQAIQNAGEYLQEYIRKGAGDKKREPVSGPMPS